MADTNALELYAEISIGLIGFAGVVAALGRSRLPAPTRRFRISALLLYGVVALAGSLLPIVLLGHGLAVTHAWLASAIALVSAQITLMAWAVRQTRPLLSDGLLAPLLTRTVFAIFLGATLYLLYGITFDRTALPGIYLVGLSFTLGLGVFHFVLLVTSVHAADD